MERSLRSAIQVHAPLLHTAQYANAIAPYANWAGRVAQVEALLPQTI